MHLTTTAVTNVERGKNEQTPEAANCFVCSRHYDSVSWQSIYILEFSMTTIDNIMTLALNYRLAGSASRDEHEEALRTALTEALAAQPVREPLSDEQIGRAWLPTSDPVGLGGKFKVKDPKHVREFARAIERAHGIGGDK